MFEFFEAMLLGLRDVEKFQRIDVFEELQIIRNKEKQTL